MNGPFQGQTRHPHVSALVLFDEWEISDGTVTHLFYQDNPG